jgi:hypothetical protein
MKRAAGFHVAANQGCAIQPGEGADHQDGQCNQQGIGYRRHETAILQQFLHGAILALPGDESMGIVRQS